MRAIFAFACGFGVIVGCGRAENDGAKGSGGNSAAPGGAASGGATSGGGQSGEATFGGHIGSGGSSVANAGGGIVASGGNGGATAGAAENPCGAGDFFLKIDGDLPGGFGANQRLSLGCPDARPGVFAVPVSFTRPPPEGGGIEVGIVACDGAALGARLEQSIAYANRETESLSYAVNRAWRSLDVTELKISEQPVADWKTLRSGSNDGVGKVYAGSFTAQGAPAGNPVTVTGSFRVCHVANLDVP